MTVLRLSWDRGYHQLIVECDNSEALQLIQSEILISHPDYHLLYELHELLRRNWKVVLQLCSRDENLVADTLAKHSLNLHSDYLIHETPPDFIRSSLDVDVSFISIDVSSATLIE